ncbi:MAG: type II CAAX endopeptidase family protein [Candidatus Limnocylindria bacterium]
MPRWPGPLLVIAGAVIGIGALGTGALAIQGQVDVEDPAVLGWLALLGAALFAIGLLYIAIRQLRVRRFLPPERYRGPGVLVLLLLVLVLASIITAPFSSDAAALLLGEGELTFLGAAVLLVATQAALLLVSWFLVFRPGALAALPSLPGRDPVGAIRSGLGWGVVAWIGATAASAGVVWALEQMGFDAEPQAAEQAIQLVDPWLVILAVVILAPIAEEIFFRGVVFNAWLREGGPRWAFIGSSVVFAAIHVSVVALLPIFLLGLALAWIYQRTGDLLAPIAMHATVNGISVALALLMRFDVVRLPV